MTTTAIGLGQVLAQETTSDRPAETPEFAQMLGEVQSGAPPGPEPPPKKVPEAGAVTHQPNAGAQKLDLLPEDAKSEDSVEDAALSFDLVALLAGQVIPTPLNPGVQIKASTAGSVAGAIHAVEGEAADTALLEAATDELSRDERNLIIARPDRARQPQTSKIDPGLFADMGTKKAPVAVVGNLLEGTKQVDGTKSREVPNPTVTKPPPSGLNLEDATSVQVGTSPKTTETTKPTTSILHATNRALVAEASNAGSPAGPGQERQKDSDGVHHILETAEAIDESATALTVEKPMDDAPVELLSHKAETSSVKTGETNSQVSRLPSETIARIVRQAADRLELLAVARANDVVTVRLDPQDLGSITMIVKSAGSQVDAQITASNDQVRMALEQNRFQLGQAMESRGLSLASLNVGQQPSGQNMADGQMRQAFQQPGDQSRQQTGVRRDLNVPSLEVQRAYARSSVGVDVWI